MPQSAIFCTLHFSFYTLDFRLALLVNYQLFFDNLSNFHRLVICQSHKVNPVG